MLAFVTFEVGDLYLSFSKATCAFTTPFGRSSQSDDAEEWLKNQDRLPPRKSTARCTFSLRFVATF